ncbi:MAG: phage Gp37/Gp68 family protein [Phenylobacterium sp.]|uniref:DUF5131 family protein n=1 Tax=Phenylobacterium sp. TaxID=1871053 RepID=UPI0012107B61|nr:phage Gp37/Gp68 family protein [Phenylobacterium sp.]TAL28993.1 MAG: phage Gp37/Gp68 family protein [Phenylobacterium sp.]
MSRTTIEWTATVNPDGTITPGATWNPTRGCDKISPGCKHCYAETFAERWRGVPGHPYEQGFDLRLVPEALSKPLGWRKPRKIFVNSMSDLFHEEVPDEYIAAVFGVMAACPQHVFQVLTKRAERLPRWFEWIRYQYGEARMTPAEGCRWEALERAGFRAPDGSMPAGPGRDLQGYDTRWPLPNVWLGVSVESPDYLWRIDELRKVPAAVRFVSFEPLLEDIGSVDVRGIDWAIIGSESGQKARPMDTTWARSLVDQCLSAGVRVFTKQIATPAGRAAGNRKGGDPTHWPAGDWPRQFPEPTTP